MIVQHIYAYCNVRDIYAFLANYTITAIKGMESYTLLQSLTDLIKDVSDLIKNPTLDGIHLKILLGDDYKVHACIYIRSIVYSLGTCMHNVYCRSGFDCIKCSCILAHVLTIACTA